MNYVPKLKNASVNTTKTSYLKEFFVYASGALTLVGLIFYLSGLAVNLLVPYITPDAEKRIFTLLADKTADKDVTAETRAQTAYVQGLLDRIPKGSLPVAYEFRIIILDMEEPNAFAFPGGHIGVTKGLLDLVPSENALVFVLGHELGHFAGRDHLYGMGRGLLIAAAGAVLFGDGQSASWLGNSLRLAVSNHFSQQQEATADMWGLKALIAQYGHAGGATDFFKVLKEKDAADEGSYFSTHPATSERIVLLQQAIKTGHYSIAPVTALRRP